MVDTLQQVKHWAECGWTQGDCAQALDMTEWKFRTWLENCHPDFKWPRNRSIAQREVLRQFSPEAAAKGRACKVAALPRYTVRGVTGTYRELAERFASVGPVTVWRRLERGWGIERALFTPSMKQPSARPGYSAGNSFGNYGGL